MRSAVFAAGGELESGCQAEYGIDALGKRRTIILSAGGVSVRRGNCREQLDAGASGAEKVD
jgi:hypothetical protein